VTRIVLDTNILAPGFTSSEGASSRLIELWRSGAYELVVSEHILAELGRAFADPYYRRRMTTEQAARVLALLRKEGIVTELIVPVVGVATQPKDDLVLSTALSGGAHLLCTRDKQLLRIGSFQTKAILSPGQLLARFEAKIE
jgi:putative PIN family toxin of toxin-antitoxin system